MIFFSYLCCFWGLVSLTLSQVYLIIVWHLLFVGLMYIDFINRSISLRQLLTEAEQLKGIQYCDPYFCLQLRIMIQIFRLNYQISLFSDSLDVHFYLKFWFQTVSLVPCNLSLLIVEMVARLCRSKM